MNPDCVAYTTSMDGIVADATEAFRVRVEERLDQLAPAERRVAGLLRDLGPQAALLSAAAIADQLGTSDATVVRTAKSLGYKGMGELRHALAAYASEPPLRERLHRTLEQAPPDRLFTTSVRNHLSALETLTNNVSPETFRDAVAILGRARRVVWRGVGPSAALATYGQLMAQRIGKPSLALTHTGSSFADELLTLVPTDALVVLAYGRLQADVRVLLQRAAALHVEVVLMTDTLARKLGDSVDVTLRCGRGAPGLFASHGTTLIVIEALVLGVAAIDEAAAQATLTELNELRAALTGRRNNVDEP